MGYNNVMFGSDYPHMEGTFGHTQDTLKALFDGVSDETRLRITQGTFYELFPARAARSRPKSPERVANSPGCATSQSSASARPPTTSAARSLPRAITELAGEAILAACEDAGVSVAEVDGFAFYSGASAGYTDKMDTGGLRGDARHPRGDASPPR